MPTKRIIVTCKACERAEAGETGVCAACERALDVRQRR